MAVLGKIRSKGVMLVIVIALGLFAFIAEEAVRSCNGIKGQASQQIGEVLGEKISVQEFQALIDESQNVVKFTAQRDNLTEDELNQVKDQVWQQYVSNKVIENDAAKLGITVTEQEVVNVLNQGTNPVLLQTPFVNQQTGRFDVNSLKQFLDQYKKAEKEAPQQAEQMKMVHDYWLFVEKNLRSQLLRQKYQGLLANCVLSNKYEAKLAFAAENEESQILLASLPYSSIKDDAIKVTDADLQAKYNELKPAFKQAVEMRDIKYVDFQIKASAADRAAIQKEMNGYQQQLATTDDPSQLVTKAGSQVAYLGLPQSKTAFPSDIAAKLDSMAVGTSGVIENTKDNTLNIIRLYSKVQLPDSVEFRQIQVAAASVDEARTKADSIYNALQGGADFETLAKKYGQTGEKTWFTGRQYEGAGSMNADNKQYIEALLYSAAGETKNLALTQGNIIVQVTDKKAVKDKFNAAVIKKFVDFSKDTRSTAYNKFSEFVTKCSSIEEMEKNAAKYGYKVSELPNITTSEHYVANIRATRDALKWIFGAKEGEISPLYECGDNDHMLVVALNKIHKKGYRDIKDTQVNDILKREVMKDKKAEQLIGKLKGVSSIAAAQAKGCKVDTVNQVTFAAPAFIQSVGAVEPALSGAVAATAKGKFASAPVKGNAGVYLFSVVNKAQRAGAKFDPKAQMQRCRQQNMQLVGNFMQDLLTKADITDNRYLFF
ncbi:MAG: SurA N-terminal domain-containing protein [Prevotella sp.]|nr:SurA N-terminal domain-containing protein [Prevotella sp.]